MILPTLAWVAVVVNLGAYALTARRTSWIWWLHWSNAICTLPIGIYYASKGTWPGVLVEAGYGIPAWFVCLREISRRRKPKGPTYKYDYSRPVHISGISTHWDVT